MSELDEVHFLMKQIRSNAQKFDFIFVEYTKKTKNCKHKLKIKLR